MFEKYKQLSGKVKILKSLKARLFVIILLAGVIPSVGMRYAILQSYEDRAVNVRIADVQNQFKILANHLIIYGYLLDTSSEVVNTELDQLSNLYDGRVLIIDQNFKVIKDTYGISEGRTVISEEVIRCFKGSASTNYDSKNGYIEITTPIVNTVVSTTSGIQAETESDTKESLAEGVILSSVSTSTIMATLDILNRRAMIVELIALVFIVAIALVLSNLLTAPFERVTQAINEVKAGFTDEEISVNDYVETEHIVDAFNQLLGRMKVLDDSRQEFVSNVSHELKTPLTSMKVLADSLMAQEEVPAELYKEFMTDIANEIERENKIISDLLSLVKMDKKAADINIVSMDINELLELILKRLRPIARTRNVEVIFESIRPVTAEVDEVKLTLALSNLVENAIKYNVPGGWVRVILDADHQFFTVEVSDSGIGIPQEELEHIYERFYRVDKSHSREIGGSGLGLAITRSAILMHRGSIRVISEEEQGTTFIVKIPLIHPV
ncbi:MAG: cell wall metabolism sensor histidine kinase WalK [Lachnospiraceae bacterium]|jgi:signal transduction histidine kinase|nr:cell wall metabolism sensor histidine kinase WalK [Lachnospiraceae bacterium]